MGRTNEEPGLRLGHLRLQQALPHPVRGRRLHAQCLALVADTSLSGVRVARELDTLVRLYGKPACIVSDNVLGREAAAENGQQVLLRRLRSALIAF
jgi:hypothetical protein